MFVWKKYVYEVYKERSFTKAAQNLYISQPSLSARIKKIEEMIGEPLFDRSTTPLQLTEVGKVYIEAAEEITQIEQRVENYINDLAGLKTGNLAVGASTLFAAYVVPSLITQFNQKFPDVHIQLIEGNTAELEEMLGSNALDFVIDNYHYDSILYNKELYCEENILLAVPKHFAVNEELGMYQLSYRNRRIFANNFACRRTDGYCYIHNRSKPCQHNIHPEYIRRITHASKIFQIRII